LPGGIKYYDPSQVDRYTSQENFNPWDDGGDQIGNNDRNAAQETMSSVERLDSFGEKW
jgi:hypothetical protein